MTSSERPAVARPVGDGVVGRLPVETVTEIVATLRHPPTRVPIPDSLLGALHAARLREFTLLVGHGRLLLPILFTVGVTSAYFLRWLSPSAGPPPPSWFATHLVIATVITSGLACASIPTLRERWYPHWVSIAASVIVGLKLHLLLLPSAAEYQRFAAFDLSITMVIFGLAMRIPLRQVLYAFALAVGLAVAASCARGLSVPLGVLALYYGASMTATLAIGVLAERQENLRFLQTVLIEHQAAEHVELNARLESLVRTDALTGLGNRRHFDEVLAAGLRRAQRRGSPVSLLVFDVDHFKAFNDRYGHPDGDACLAALGEAVRSILFRSDDFAARIGGEEFSVVLPDTDETGAREVADRLLAAVDARAIPHAASTTAPHVTVSVGIAVCRAAGEITPTALVRAADAALYAAKRGGRHRVEMAD